MIDLFLLLGIFVAIVGGGAFAVTRKTPEGALGAIVLVLLIVFALVFTGMWRQGAACEAKGGTLVRGSDCIDRDAVLD